MRWPASSNSSPVSRWSDLLRVVVRWDHWASDFCRTASNSARSMIGGCDHYFFVPQVELDNGDFVWLSSVRPIVAPGTPFAPDLQAWTRDEFLDPDWLRIGTD